MPPRRQSRVGPVVIHPAGGRRMDHTDAAAAAASAAAPADVTVDIELPPLPLPAASSSGRPCTPPPPALADRPETDAAVSPTRAIIRRRNQYRQRNNIEDGSGGGGNSVIRATADLAAPQWTSRNAEDVEAFWNEVQDDSGPRAARPRQTPQLAARRLADVAPLRLTGDELQESTRISLLPPPPVIESAALPIDAPSPSSASSNSSSPPVDASVVDVHPAVLSDAPASPSPSPSPKSNGIRSPTHARTLSHHRASALFVQVPQLPHERVHAMDSASLRGPASPSHVSSVRGRELFALPEQQDAEPLTAAIHERRPSLDHSLAELDVLFDDEAQREGERCYTLRRCIRKRQLPMIPHDSQWLLYWHALLLTIVLYNAVLIPWRLAFGESTYPYPATIWIDILLDLPMFLDMIVRLHTTSPDVTDEQKEHPGGVRAHYIRTWMWPDLLINMPWDLFELTRAANIPSVRIPKLVHCLKLGFLKNRVTSELWPALKLVEGPFLLMFIAHIESCIYIAISRGEGYGSSAFVLDENMASSQGSAYMHAYLWSFVSLTDRDYYGGTPGTLVQYLFVLGGMVAGVIGLALVIGRVTSSIDESNAQSKLFQSKVLVVSRFLASYRISAEMKKQVQIFHEFVWSTKQETHLPAVLAELPEVLVGEISTVLLQATVRRVDLLYGLDADFHVELIKRMNPAVYLPDEILITEGSEGQSMFFLQRGEVELTASGMTEQPAVRRLTSGSHFGELSLVLHVPHRLSARACGFCTVYILRRTDFEEIKLRVRNMQLHLKASVVAAGVAVGDHTQNGRMSMLLSPATTTTTNMNMLENGGGGGSGGGVGAVGRKSGNSTATTTDTPQVNGTSLPPSEVIISPTKPPPAQDPIHVLLTLGVNARTYRKKVVVYAFSVDSPVTIHKPWGISSCQPGDWLVVSGNNDAYTVPNSEFRQSYEAMSIHGAPHQFHKRATVLAVQVAQGFKFFPHQGGPPLTCVPGEYLVQDDTRKQYLISESSFDASYQLVSSTPQQPAAMVSTEVKAIREMERRQDGGQGQQQHIRRTREDHHLIGNPGGTSPTFLLPGVLSPTSRFWRTWTWLVILVALYNMFMLPFRLAFDIHSVHPVYLVCDYLGDGILILDVFFRFRLAFEKEGQLVVDLKIIRGRYLRSAFTLDLAACMNLDVLMIYIGMQPLLRVGRLLKMFTLHRWSSVYIRRSRHHNLYNLLRMLFLFVLLCHYVACVYYVFTVFDDDLTDPTAQSIWLPLASERTTLTNKYLRSQYFAMTVLTGWGQLLRPQTVSEVAYSIASTMIGVLVVSIVIGEVVSLMDFDALATDHSKKLVAIQECLRANKLPIELQHRVKRYVEHAWQIRQGADMASALVHLPPSLRVRLQLEVCGGALRRTPFFAHATDTTLLAVVSALRFEAYPLGEVIFIAGQIGTAMYIVQAGLVAIQMPIPAKARKLHGEDTNSSLAGTKTIKLDQSCIHKTLGKGSLFGEGALLSSLDITSPSGAAASANGGMGAGGSSGGGVAGGVGGVGSFGATGSSDTGTNASAGGASSSNDAAASLPAPGRRAASAIAVTSCELMVLARDDVLSIMRQDLTFAVHLQQLARERLGVLRQRAQKANGDKRPKFALRQQQINRQQASSSVGPPPNDAQATSSSGDHALDAASAPPPDNSVKHHGSVVAALAAALRRSPTPTHTRDRPPTPRASPSLVTGSRSASASARRLPASTPKSSPKTPAGRARTSLAYPTMQSPRGTASLDSPSRRRSHSLLTTLAERCAYLRVQPPASAAQKLAKRRPSDSGLQLQIARRTDHM